MKTQKDSLYFLEMFLSIVRGKGNNDTDVRLLSSPWVFGHAGMPRKGKHIARWCGIRAARKWGISVWYDMGVLEYYQKK